MVPLSMMTTPVPTLARPSRRLLSSPSSPGRLSARARAPPRRSPPRRHWRRPRQRLLRDRLAHRGVDLLEGQGLALAQRQARVPARADQQQHDRQRPRRRSFAARRSPAPAAGASAPASRGDRPVRALRRGCGTAGRKRAYDGLRLHGAAIASVNGCHSGTCVASTAPDRQTRRGRRNRLVPQAVPTDCISKQ